MISTSTFDATKFSASSTNVKLVPLPTDKLGPVTGVGYLTNGEWLKYAAVDFGSGVESFVAKVSVADAYKGQHLELHLDSPTGQLIGTLVVQGTAGWYNYTSQTAVVTAASGVHDLYFVSKSSISGVCNISSFSFVEPAIEIFDAKKYNSASANVKLVPLPTDKLGPVTGVGYLTGGEWLEYSNVDFGAGVTTFTANVAVADAYKGQNLELRVDSTTGPVIGTLSVHGTSTWYNYTTQSTTVSVSGVHNLYLISKATISGCCNIASFSFAKKVIQKTPTIIWNSPVAITYGDALISQLNATSPVPGSFVYTPAVGTVLTAGTHSLSVNFTPTDTTNYTPATATVNISVSKAIPLIVWNKPKDISKGEALGDQLNATANVSGTFVYSPPAGTILIVGDGEVLLTTFTPTDTNNYTTATASVTINVSAPIVPVSPVGPPPVYSYPFPLDAEGFSVINPSADTQMIYVSSSTGNDKNAGSKSSPLKTISVALKKIRNGFPDWVCLMNGDSWNESLASTASGRSPQEPIVISSYGDPKLPRPYVGFNGGSIVHSWGSNLAILGIHFDNMRNPALPGLALRPGGGGLNFSGSNHVIIEDCFIEWNEINITVQGSTTVNIKGFAIRNNILTDAYAGDGGFSQGIFLDWTEQPIIEGNLIHNSGWNNIVPLATDAMFNHGIYNGDSNGVPGTLPTSTGSIIRNNIISQSASSGIEQRPGGVIEDNLFLQNGTAADAWTTGVVGWIINNVCTVSADCLTEMPLYSGGGFTFSSSAGEMSGNLVVHGNAKTSFPAFTIERQTGPFANLPILPTYYADVHNNVVYDWQNDGIDYISQQRPHMLVHDNAVSQCHRKTTNFRPTAPPSGTYTPILIMSNNYYDPASQFFWNNSQVSFDQWEKNVNSTTDHLVAPVYVEPTRTIESYIKLNNFGVSFSDFISNVKKQRKGSWNPALTAHAVNEYFRDGFQLA